jgi:hypothetical protein
MALGWLERNTINRPLRRTVVEGYKAAYMRGEHRLTHQGIAFSRSGELLDGQHRLTAISEMPSNFAAEMMVTTDVAPEAFDAIDQGLKRTHSDVLRIPSGHAAVARYMAVLADTTSRAGITSQSLVPFVEGSVTPYMQLTGFCPKCTKVWSGAAVRSAAILQLLAGRDHDYICLTYWSLNHMDFDSMSDVAQTLFKQQTKGSVAGGYDMFCRAFKVFDQRNSSLDKIQITDPATIISKAREIIHTKVLGNGMKKAPTSAGAKKVHSPNSKATARA